MLGLLSTLLIVTSAVAANRFKRDEQCAKCQAQDDYISKNIDRSDWMYSNKDKLANKQLVNLKLIGTHHSTSYSIHQLFDAFSVCQNTHLSNQLKAGVRYLDLRVGWYGNALRIGHSIHAGGPVEGFLQEILTFVKAHPKEFLIVNIRDSDWTPIPPKNKFQLINMVKSIFADRMVTSGDSWFDLSTVTMGQIWEQNRNVFIIYGDKLLWTVDTGNGQANNISQSDADSWGLRAIQNVYDRWPNTAKVDELFNKMNDYYDNKPVPRNKFYVAQLLLTANPLQTPTLDNLTEQLQKTGRIRQWLRDHPDYAIAYLDFFLGVSNNERKDAVALLDEIIQANFQ